VRKPSLIFAAALSIATAAPALAAESVEGLWMVQDHTAKVRIGPCPGRSDQLCGQIVWVHPRPGEEAAKTDIHNADPKLRDRPILGLPLIRDFRAAGPGRWEGGKIYDPRSGKTYNSKMQLMSGGELKVEGCVMMFCQTQTWTRTS
jgi:uncharacterized protein (DUF2147 family)